MKIVAAFIFLLMSSYAHGQDLFFTASFENNGTSFRFPAYWRDHMTTGDENQNHAPIAFADQETQKDLIATFESSIDQARWPSSVLALVSRCYWEQKDPSKAEGAIVRISADSPDSLRPEVEAWRAFLFAARGVHHQWILEKLSDANRVDPCLDYKWCLFWECCRAEDQENGLIHLKSLLPDFDRLNYDERLLVLWFIAQAKDRALMDALVELATVSGEHADKMNVEGVKQPRIVRELVGLCKREHLLQGEIEEIELTRFVLGTDGYKELPGEETIVPTRNKNDIESGSLGPGSGQVFKNLIHLSLPYSPPPPDDGWGMFDSTRAVYALFDCSSAMASLIRSYESGRSNRDRNTMELIVLGYLASGEYEKANRLFPEVIANKQITDETDELLLLLQVESLLIVPSTVESGKKLALEYKNTCKNARFRFLALWAALAVEDWNTAKELLDEYFETGSSDPWFHYAIPGALTFAMKCPDEKSGRAMFERAIEACTPLAERGDKQSLVKTKIASDLGRSVVRKFESKALSKDILDDPVCFASDVTILFVEGSR